MARPPHGDSPYSPLDPARTDSRELDRPSSRSFLGMPAWAAAMLLAALAAVMYLLVSTLL